MSWGIEKVHFIASGRFDGPGIITYSLSNGVQGGTVCLFGSGGAWSRPEMNVVGSPEQERFTEFGDMKLSKLGAL